MLSTPLICCSTGVATDCSSVNASAPTYVAHSWICGGAMLGNCAIGSCTNAAAPTITMRMAMTMATTGRLTKNFAIGHYLLFILRSSQHAQAPPDPFTLSVPRPALSLVEGGSGRMAGLAGGELMQLAILRSHRGADNDLRGGGLGHGRLRIHHHPGLHFLSPLDHDPLARLEPLRDDPHVPDLLADFHRAHVYFIVGPDHRDLRAALQLLDRLLRHKHRPLPGLGRDSDLGVLTGAENVLGIGEQALHGDGAGP